MENLHFLALAAVPTLESYAHESIQNELPSIVAAIVAECEPDGEVAGDTLCPRQQRDNVDGQAPIRGLKNDAGHTYVAAWFDAP
jgi:hypothetical protein